MKVNIEGLHECSLPRRGLGTGITSEWPVIQAFPFERAPRPHPSFADTSKLFSRVKRFFKLADVGHHSVEVGFPAKVHFSHLLVVPVEGRFKLGAGRQAESSLFSEFISRAALPEKVLLMFHDLLQQIVILKVQKRRGSLIYLLHASTGLCEIMFCLRVA